MQAVEHVRFVDCCAEYARMCVVATRIFALLDQLRQQLESLETSSDPEEAPEDQNNDNTAEEDAPAPKNDFF